MDELNSKLHDLAVGYTRAAQQALGDDLVSVVLFGSVARQECRPYSDIDLVIILREAPKSAFRRREILEPIRAEFEHELEKLWEKGCYVDFAEVIMTADEAKKTHRLYLEILEDGIILYDVKNFFGGILEDLRSKLQKIGACRRTLGKLRYWDLKPDFKPGDVIEI